MSQMMFSRTGSDDFPSYLKCMISGPPKSGKTSLLGTVPNILVLDTEPHANNLQSVAHLDLPFKAIYSTDELRQAQFILSQEAFRKQAAQALGMPDIEAVGIDTLDTFQSIMKKERMREQRSTKFYRDDWGWLKEEMVAILESFLALPMHVFFVVHTKTKDIGSEDNPQTIILPGLEGSIAESIAGMVGYSLLSFRTEEIKADGSKFTKYWLRAEGNDTYQFLGNRAGGRLPDVIEPDFKTLLDAAMAGRPTASHQQVAVPVGAPTGTAQQQQVQQPIQTPVGNTAAQPVVTSVQATHPGVSVSPAPSQPLAQNPSQQEAAAPSDKPGDNEPVNAAALGFVKKVYDAIGQVMPEDKILALNLGQARNLVRAWKAIQVDHEAGVGTGAEEMIEYLRGQDLLSDGPAPEAPKAVEPNLHGTIEEVKAYVGDDLARANEAFEVERSGKNRKSLMEWLESKGASHGGVQTPVQTDEPEPEVPETPAEPAETPVTPTEPVADGPVTEDQAVANVQEALGGEVISEGINAEALCEECGNQIDDVDLAQLGKSRFGRVLCVADYIAETKKK